MLPEGLRRQPKARSPASLRQGASQTFFQQIYAFTIAATNQDAVPTSERFIITINLGEDRLLIDKPIACGRLDDNGNIIDDTAPSELLAIASKREDGNSGEPL